MMSFNDKKSSKESTGGKGLCNYSDSDSDDHEPTGHRHFKNSADSWKPVNQTVIESQTVYLRTDNLMTNFGHKVRNKIPVSILKTSKRKIQQEINSNIGTDTSNRTSNSPDVSKKPLINFVKGSTQTTKADGITTGVKGNKSTESNNNSSLVYGPHLPSTVENNSVLGSSNKSISCCVKQTQTDAIISEKRKFSTTLPFDVQKSKEQYGFCAVERLASMDLQEEHSWLEMLVNQLKIRDKIISEQNDKLKEYRMYGLEMEMDADYLQLKIECTEEEMQKLRLELQKKTEAGKALVDNTDSSIADELGNPHKSLLAAEEEGLPTKVNTVQSDSNQRRTSHSISSDNGTVGGNNDLLDNAPPIITSSNHCQLNGQTIIASIPLPEVEPNQSSTQSSKSVLPPLLPPPLPLFQSCLPTLSSSSASNTSCSMDENNSSVDEQSRNATISNTVINLSPSIPVNVISLDSVPLPSEKTFDSSKETNLEVSQSIFSTTIPPKRKRSNSNSSCGSIEMIDPPPKTAKVIETVTIDDTKDSGDEKENEKKSLSETPNGDLLAEKKNEVSIEEMLRLKKLELLRVHEREEAKRLAKEAAKEKEKELLKQKEAERLEKLKKYERKRKRSRSSSDDRSGKRKDVRTEKHNKDHARNRRSKTPDHKSKTLDRHSRNSSKRHQPESYRSSNSPDSKTKSDKHHKTSKKKSSRENSISRKKQKKEKKKSKKKSDKKYKDSESPAHNHSKKKAKKKSKVKPTEKPNKLKKNKKKKVENSSEEHDSDEHISDQRATSAASDYESKPDRKKQKKSLELEAKSTHARNNSNDSDHSNQENVNNIKDKDKNDSDNEHPEENRSDSDSSSDSSSDSGTDNERDKNEEESRVSNDSPILESKVDNKTTCSEEKEIDTSQQCEEITASDEPLNSEETDTNGDNKLKDSDSSETSSKRYSLPKNKENSKSTSELSSDVMETQNFEFLPEYQLYYDSNSGYYYDSVTRVYFDSSNYNYCYYDDSSEQYHYTTTLDDERAQHFTLLLHALHARAAVAQDSASTNTESTITAPPIITKKDTLVKDDKNATVSKPEQSSDMNSSASAGKNESEVAITAEIDEAKSENEPATLSYEEVLRKRIASRLLERKKSTEKPPGSVSPDTEADNVTTGDDEDISPEQLFDVEYAKHLSHKAMLSGGSGVEVAPSLRLMVVGLGPITPSSGINASNNALKPMLPPTQISNTKGSKKLQMLHVVTLDGAKVGRLSKNGVHLPHISVSKEHAEISYRSDSPSDHHYYIKDLGSNNGTYINGERLSASKQASEPLEVGHGWLINFGEVQMQAHIHPGHLTCNTCEPGLVPSSIGDQEAVKHDKGLTSEGDRRSTENVLRKKYGLRAHGIDNSSSDPFMVGSSYSDRAGTRRVDVGSDNPYEKTQVASVHESIGSNNKGFKLLQKMGWAEGSGLGKTVSGRVNPVHVEGRSQGVGLGADQLGAVSTDSPRQRAHNAIKKRYADAT